VRYVRQVDELVVANRILTRADLSQVPDTSSSVNVPYAAVTMTRAS